MTTYSAKESVTLKIVYNKKEFFFFEMNMQFISSREAKKIYFNHGYEATIEILVLHKMKLILY